MNTQKEIIESLSNRALWLAACTAFSNETGYDPDDWTDDADEFGEALAEIDNNVDLNVGGYNDEEEEETADPSYGLTDWRAGFKAFFSRHPEFLNDELVAAAKRAHGLDL